MDFALKAVLVALLALLAVAYCADSEDSQINKRDTENTEHHLALEDDEDLSELDKRRIFRYGRGVFRYGKRAPVFRYGKRGTIFRYGKRDDDDSVSQEGFDDVMDDVMKRVFRYGKRSPGDPAYKRVFKWGKRDGSDSEFEQEEDKRGIFRYGKREADLADADFIEALKRKVFRFGKREDADNLMEEQKRGLSRDSRAPESPHVPFRFGEE